MNDSLAPILVLPLSLEVSVVVCTPEGEIARWLEATVVLHRSNRPDICLHDDVLDEALAPLWTTLKWAEQGVLPEPIGVREGFSLGKLYNQSILALSSGTNSSSSPQDDPLSKCLLWSCRGVLTFLYRTGESLQMEISPVMPGIFDAEPKDKSTLHFLADYEPYYRCTLGPNLMSTWVNTMHRVLNALPDTKDIPWI